MKKLTRLMTALCLLQARIGVGASSPTWEGQESMNGYTLKQFGDVPRHWRLVTVRFRKDSEEMRFTYANEIAWNALTEGAKKFPDGAVFIKLGFMTKPDPAFISSVVPSGSRRYQIMVRDEKKHRATEGWGYALFDADGKTFDEDPKELALACAVCHNLVPERGFVYSQLMPLQMPSFSKKMLEGEPEAKAKINFETVLRAKLPDPVRREIPEKYQKVESITGALRSRLFQGTLDEIRPMLLERASRTNTAALLLSQDGARFSIVFPDPSAKDCASEGPKAVSFRSVLNFLEAGKKNLAQFVCYEST